MHKLKENQKEESYQKFSPLSSKSKVKFLLFLLCIFQFSPSIFAQTLEWAYSFQNGVVLEDVTDISANGNDRFVLLGFTDPNTVSIDPINKKTEYKPAGKYVAVYNENAEIQWMKTAAANPLGVKMNSNSEVFVTGSFGGTVDFDPSDKVFNLSSPNAGSCFLQKFDPSGNLVWAVGATTDGIGVEIEPMPDGRIIVAGRSDVASKVTLSNNSVVDLQKGIFLLEVSADGKLTNAYSIAVPDAAGYGYVFDLASDDSNNIFVCGQIDGVADFDLDSGTANNLKTRAYDAYVAKYNSQFKLQWYKVFGDINVAPYGWDIAHSLAVDVSGNLFVGGQFTWTTDFDPVSNPGKTKLISDTRTQTPSGFIMQYTTDGSLNWVKKIGAPNMDTGIFGETRVRGIQLQGNTIFSFIETSRHTDVDPSEAEVKYTSTGASSLIFATFTNEGIYQKSFHLDTPLLYTISKGFEMLGSESFVTSGTFQKDSDFDPTSATKLLKTDPKGFAYSFDKDIFIAKYKMGTATAAKPFVLAGEVKVYPNPFTNEISISANLAQRISSVKIYNMEGKLILSGTENLIRLNTEALHSGMYILDAIFEDGSIYRTKLLRK